MIIRSKFDVRGALKPVWEHPHYPIWTNHFLSEDGRLFRLTPRGPIEKRASPNTDGYLRLALGTARAGRIEAAHRMVHKLFVGPIPEGFDVHHIDGNRSNNSAINL